ncbi:MAG: hypothetical protein JW755_09410 [Candidatus Aminicenantes bacterium]|nr:hypothetical protein [Candidatus Aminicenantes bacterium]
MTRRKFVLFIGLALTTALICSDYSSLSGEKSNFNTNKYVDAWIKMWNTYDLDQVDELFLLDNRLTYFSSEKEGIIIGINAVRDHHIGFGFVKRGKKQPNKLWLEDINSTEFNSSAVVTGIWYFQRQDGSIQRGPVTIVYVQQGDSYRIAHMNFSNYQEPEE